MTSYIKYELECIWIYYYRSTDQTGTRTNDILCISEFELHIQIHPQTNTLIFGVATNNKLTKSLLLKYTVINSY